MKENKTLELKADISRTFLKTVSAFANFGSGRIVFGIDDDGTVCGLKDPNQTCLDIENMINDSINPKPDYSLRKDRNTIVLTVNEGRYKPYMYNGKAYRRSDTATVEVDQVELKRLVLEGNNMYYESLPCKEHDLTFTYFEEKLKEKIGITSLTNDMLRTFGFYTDDELNVAAALFADRNAYHGIDMIRFGNSISVIHDRETYAGISILQQYDRAVALYAKYYQQEVIDGIDRRKVETVPEKAFREAVANALVHRLWDIDAHIRIAMFPDRIEITSPGGLPGNVSREEYLNGNVSILRNPVIGNVFFRMHYIEMFGTGITRIKEAYIGNPIQPQFDITDNAIKVVLPIIDDTYFTTTDEKRVLDLLSSGRQLTSREVGNALGFSKDKAIRLLNALIEKKYVFTAGNGRGTTYSLSR